MVRFELGIWNAWLLTLPFLFLPFLMGINKDIMKRMSDMTGYTTREKFFTIFASISPYPFMIATIWVPLVSIPLLLAFGLLIYILGMALCAASLRIIIKTPADKPFTAGPYRVSRNPMYVSATIVFTGICLATANVVLLAYLAAAVLPQHFMILAEERICKEKYGRTYEAYLHQVPRYLFLV